MLGIKHRSGFWQLQHSYLSLVLAAVLCIFLISFSSAIELGISPPELIFEGRAYENICSNLTLFASREVSLLGSTVWSSSIEKTRNINEYTIYEEPATLITTYPKEVFFNGRKDIEVCVYLKENAKHYGLLLYEDKNSFFSVGSWIYIKADNKSLMKEKNFLLGNLSKAQNNTFPLTLLGMFSLQIVLCFILLFLFLKSF